MNNGAFGENFPYSNFHNLNMDWIIKIAKDFLDQYTHIQDIISAGETSLTDSITEKLQQLETKADNLEELLQNWYNTHSEDIANELADALTDMSQALSSALSSINTTASTVLNQFYTDISAKAQETIDSIPEDYTTLSNKVNSYGSSNSMDEYPGYTKFSFDNYYNIDFKYFELHITGFNTTIIINGNGGNIVERINDINYDRINMQPMIINGSHIYRVYNDDRTKRPFFFVKNNEWVGGYSDYNSGDRLLIEGNLNRCSMFIEVKDKEFIDIDCDSGSQVDMFYLDDDWINLQTRGFLHYTANKGKYQIRGMNSNPSTEVTKDTIKRITVRPVTFPKPTGYPVYEEMKYYELEHGAQGICCTNDYVYMFSGLGEMFKFNFNGDLLNIVEIPRTWGHCNSATFRDGMIYLVDSGDTGSIKIINPDTVELLYDINMPYIINLSYVKNNNKFYGIKADSIVDGFANGVHLYQFDVGLSTETLIKSNMLPDGKYVIQGIENQGNELIILLMDENYYGIIAYYDLTGTLLRWRYAQYTYEIEDVAINKNGEMYISYQGISAQGLPAIMIKCTNFIKYNASENATSIMAGVALGEYHKPLSLYADEDHMLFEGKITGTITEGNVAKVSANLVPHIIYKIYNKGLCNVGTTARNKRETPVLANFTGNTQTEFNMDNYMVSLKNDRWFTDSL